MDYRQNQPWQKYYEDGPVGPTGIGGWLVVFLIGRFLSVITAIGNVFYILSQTDIITRINGGAFIFTFGLVFYIVDAGLELSIIILIFSKNIIFRTMFMVMILFVTIGTIALPVLSNAIYGSKFQFDPYMILLFGVSILWTIYFSTSKRVKNTFPSRKKKADTDDALAFTNPSGG